MEKSKTFWLYCDKITGEPLLTGKNCTLYLMPHKPTTLQCAGYGSARGTACVARKATLTLADQFITPTEKKKN